MGRIAKSLIIAIVVILFAFTAVLKTPLVKYPVSLSFSRCLKSDISIKKCGFSFTKGIKASGIEIKNKKGLHCIIKDADIQFDFLYLAKKGLSFNYSLKSVRFSYPASELINGIARLFAIEPTRLLKFDTVDGIVYIKPDEMVIKDLNATGKDISLFANGTTTENKYINYALKLILSESLTSKIPENMRQFFFKKEQEHSIVELYLSGNVKKPSINFSTPLFKLRIK